MNQDLTKGDMRSTPYNVNNKQLDYSAKRTSKVKYLSERYHPGIDKLSARMELALGVSLYNPNYRYTSENFQVRLFCLN